MQAVHGYLFSYNDNDNSISNLTLPPLATTDGKPMLKSVEWLSEQTTTPPAFLEPQPQTTMDQQHDAIRHPRPHRLSLSSLSSISTESSFEDDQMPQQLQGSNRIGLSGAMNHSESATTTTTTTTSKSQQEQLSRNIPSLPPMTGFSGTTTSGYDTCMNQRQLSKKINEDFTPSASMDHPLPHVAAAYDQDRRRFGSLSPRSDYVDRNNSSSNNSRCRHRNSVSQNLPLASSSPSSSSSSVESLSVDSSPSPSSPLPSSLMTFWALPTSANNEQQHEFVTKNAHIKRPRNAWIHFRCYFGQSLKAKDPTIRAEEISKRASEYWSRLTSKQKKPWHVMAEQEKLAHQEAFPDYRYRPKRALPKSVVLSYPTTTTTTTSPTLACNLDHSNKKFRLA